MTFRQWLLGTPEPSTVEQWRAVWAAPVIRTGPADTRRTRRVVPLNLRVYREDRDKRRA